MRALETRGLSKNFGGLKAASDVSLDVEEGERRAIIGPNGAGKTTLFHLISGFLLPTSGTVSLFGSDVTHLKIHRRAALGVSRTFQVTNLFQKLTVFDNILLAVQATTHDRFCFWRPARSISPIVWDTERLLEEWNLTEKRETPVKNLSYGEQRQMEVILALATNPRLLLLDEPTAGLSAAESASMTAFIKGLSKRITIILIEHDMDVAFEIADTITVLYFGGVLAEGRPDEIRGNARVAEVYLG